MDSVPLGFRKAGTAKRVITPRKPIWLAGYSTDYVHRRAPSSGVLRDIHARALALCDEVGEVSVIVSADLLGFSDATVELIASTAQQNFGIRRERLVLNASHNHSGPTTPGLLESFYDLDAANRRVVNEYSDWLHKELIELIGDAVDALSTSPPVELTFAQGLAGFGVNRRRARGQSRHLPGVTDHDVPVLCIRDRDNGAVRAVMFGYACHATASNGQLLHGDYPGFAQDELEQRFPGATALFITGCAGDINPLPRYRARHPQLYGQLLADAVEDVVHSEMLPVRGVLQATFGKILLPLQSGQNCPYQIQTWRFGNDLICIWLAGEPVVDYSLLFKNRYGWENTWVAGYCNQLLAYIPSERVLAEGGYEGGDGNGEYGLPTPFAAGIENIIADAVEEQVSAARPQEVAFA